MIAPPGYCPAMTSGKSDTGRIICFLTTFFWQRPFQQYDLTVVGYGLALQVWVEFFSNRFPNPALNLNHNPNLNLTLTTIQALNVPILNPFTLLYVYISFLKAKANFNTSIRDTVHMSAIWHAECNSLFALDHYQITRALTNTYAESTMLPHIQP